MLREKDIFYKRLVEIYRIFNAKSDDVHRMDSQDIFKTIGSIP